MKKLGFSLTLVSLLLIVLTPGTGFAQGPVGPQAVSAWTGEYFNNTTLTGSPAHARDDANVDFSWQAGTSPAPGYVNVDNYSVRWTRLINFPSTGKWTFHFIADDGVRVWVDGNIVIDAWYDQAPMPHLGTLTLTAGWHTVRVEYYNRTLGGTAKLSYWTETTYTDWKAEYFANQTLTGAPVFIRNDQYIDWYWGTGSPEVRIPPDHFSVRWTRSLFFNAGKWRFTTTTDDGVRLWVDNTLVLDRWVDQPPTAHSIERDMSQGDHTIRMEYYENAGGAMAKLTIAPVPSTSDVWRGKYYNNISLSGTPSLVRDDPDINFNWGFGSPGAPISPDNFSIRWDTRQQFPAGYHVFSITSDDGARVWVDSELLIDAWYDRPPTTSSAGKLLEAGLHDVRVEYYERGGGAMAVLKISLGVPPPTGEVVVDDGSAGWRAGGTPTSWRNAYTGIGGHAFWTYNNTYAASSYNWARWYPTLPRAGNYEVFAYIPRGLGTTLNARYWVYHNNRYDSTIRNQGLYADQWVSLGIHYFHAQGNENVSLSDVTYECYLCRTLVFDAVKFVPR